MKRSSLAAVLVSCISLLAGCCVFSPFGDEFGKAFVRGLFESAVYVFTGTESVRGLETTDVWTDEPVERHAALHFRLQALASAEIDADEETSQDEEGGRIRVRRLELAHREGEPDPALALQGFLSKEGSLVEQFHAWKRGEVAGTPRHTVLWSFDAGEHEMQERLLLLERVEHHDPGEFQTFVGPRTELVVEVRRLKPAEPGDPEYTGNDILYFVGQSSSADLHALRERMSLLLGMHRSSLDRVQVHFSSNCKLGDLIGTLQLLADLGVVDVLIVLLAEGQHGPGYWTE